MHGRADQAVPIAAAIVVMTFEPAALIDEKTQHKIEHPQGFAGDVLGHGRLLIEGNAASYHGHEAPQRAV
jgi:hypothetical protein